MKLKLGVLFIVVGVCAVAAFGYWRYRAAKESGVTAHVGILRDPSGSRPDDCNHTVGLSERALALPGVTKVATISLLAVGDEASAFEPRMVGRLPVPATKTVIEGQRAAARQRQGLLPDIRGRCEEVKQTETSPIYNGLVRSVEYVKGLGSPSDSFYLFVQTDGEETVNQQIKKALSEPASAKLSLPPLIRNEGVHLVFCGMAETIGQTAPVNGKSRQLSRPRGPQRAERIQQVWSALFSDPSLVSFEPFCPQSQLAANVAAP
jgi:hypothetical protein